MSARFSSLLIANRGEIACRILRAARAEGLRVVAVYSDADADAPHVRLADAAVRIGPSASAQSYLSIQTLLEAAKAAGAGAIHPGYGFLAENADFADAATAAGLIFVGPPASAIRAMGDKSAAKARMQAAGVPCAPGYHGDDQRFARFAEEGERIGYPVMVKASAGGGGRGLRIVREPEGLQAAIETARAEALSAFGDGRLLIERALLGARHVEVQVFGDEQGNIVHLGERDCSIQRRHQKLIEEAPSPVVSVELRAAMGEAAVRAARTVGYVGAGTIEFLLDADGRFYFLEMNTRIQVEHPVTEAVTGVDVVRLQLQVAQGRPLPFAQGDVAFGGHAIEARLYAEDENFAPSTGRIAAWRPAAGEGVRVDAGVEPGSVVTPFYDSMLAKTLAFGRDREEARMRLIAALEQTFVAGVATNREFLLHALRHQSFVAGHATTGFVEEAPFVPTKPSRIATALAALVFVARGGSPKPTAGWRASPVRLFVDGVERRVMVRRLGFDWSVSFEGEDVRLSLVDASLGALIDERRRELPPPLWGRAGEGGSRDRRLGVVQAEPPPSLTLPHKGGGERQAVDQTPFREREVRFAHDGVVARATYVREGDELWLDLDGACRRFVDRTYAPPEPESVEADGAVRSPVSGVVVAVEAKAGDTVKRGQALATVEAMKMQYAILAPIDGVVAEAHAAAGRQTSARALLFAIAPSGG